ncbi:TRAP transporter substrate-binding protein [Azospirillum canadense]|uniref:TRAP transporter substrate-binding protein n=1 Tax=Azospirillum canadense TaxID=403962 RepID=UPI002225E66F|nr:TRAP transporter substrate-binding protein DctP [Azospirillum canadense]MCW2239839.1 TRAP-type C4-dicarboxylate transport system substrate-binding protein [Azospirillum canadense]
MRLGLTTALISAGMAMGFAGLASAQEVTKLKYATHLASTAPGVVEGSNVFINATEELSGKSVKIQLYPAEQLGKAREMFDLVKSGAIDVGTVSTALVSSDKLPLMGVLEAPGLATNACSVVNALFALGAPGGPIFEGDFKSTGVRVLAYFPYPPYGPAASRGPITKVEDLHGLKMRNAGGLMEYSVVKLGGVPVKMGSPEVFTALQRGTIDTVLFSFLSVKELDLSSIAKYGTTGYSFGTPGDLLIISERKFASFPKAQQDALVAAGKKASDHWCAYVDQTEAKNIADMRAAGMSIYTWTPDDIAKLNKLTADVAKEWASALDSRGKPGTKVLEGFKAAMKQ